MPEYITGNHRVTIEGTLVVKKLAWLSPEGRELIQEDLQDRDRSLATMTLHNLYGSSKPSTPLAVKIRLRATKNMAASFFHSELQNSNLRL